MSKAGKAATANGDGGNAANQGTLVVNQVLKGAGVQHGTIRISSLNIDPGEMTLQCRIESPAQISAFVAKQIEEELKRKFKKETVKVKIVTDLAVGGK